MRNISFYWIAGACQPCLFTSEPSDLILNYSMIIIVAAGKAFFTFVCGQVQSSCIGANPH